MSTITYGPSKRDSIIDRSITSIKSNASSVGRYAFYGCKNLTSAEFPNATTVGYYAFSGCTSLTSVESPKATVLGNYAFYGCTNLIDTDFTSVTAIGQYAFQNCSKLTEIPVSTSINFYDARGCFQGCTGLTVAHITNDCAQDMFNGCTGLTTAVMRDSTLSLWNRAFQNCSKLEIADIHGSGLQYISLFKSCSALNILIIRRTTIQDLGYEASNNNFAFASTPFASGGAGGTIYIPKVLYDHLGDGTSYDYKAAAKWATADALGTITWAPIEGSYYETHYADGTLISS